MAMADADDSAVLNESRDSDSESRTDDERLERRMRRAVLDLAYLDGNFSEDESRRVLRSSARNEEVNKEPAAMETEAAPPMPEGDSARDEEGTTPPSAENNSEKTSDIQNVAKNNVKKIEIKFLKAVDPANLSGAGSSTDTPPNPSGGGEGFSKPNGGGVLCGHSDDENGAYRAVKALRRSCMYNHRLSVGGGGGPEIASNLVGSFSEGDKSGKLAFVMSDPFSEKSKT
jgi:hypothetical protein